MEDFRDIVLEENSFIWNGNGGGNPYHDKEGKFTFSPASFKNFGGGDAEISDSPLDWYVTEAASKEIKRITANIKTARDCIKFLEDRGVKASVDYKDLSEKHPDYKDLEFKAMEQQVQAIASSYAICENLFGKGSLSSLKEVHFYSDISDGQGGFYVKLKGETEPKAGLLELGTNISSRAVLHEFVHVVQASNAKGEQDAVTWSNTMLKRLKYEGKAYFGAKEAHMAAEVLADEVSFGIANGNQKRLQLVADMANIVKPLNKEKQKNYNPGQPRDALGRWAGVGADYTFIEKKALGLLSTEQIRSYVRGKYPGKPKVVDGDTFDNTDGIDIFRGVDNVAQAMDYVKSNKHFSTNEMQGITGHDFHEDFEVAKANRDAEAKIKRKYVVIQARLDTSRMTTYENLVQERNDYCPEQDLTTFAVDKGYSAVKIQNGTVVVLDKTATTVFDGSLREYDDETFNNRKNNMDRLERLNNIIDRLDNFNPYHDKLGRFTTGKGGAAGGTGGSDAKSPSTSKVKMKDSTCGIPGDMSGDEIKSIPRLKGLNKKQKQIESEAISHWEDPKERERLVNSLVDSAEKKLAEGKDAIIETDAMKEELAKGWGKDSEYRPLSEKYSDYSKKIDLENKLNNFYNQPKEKQDLKELAKLNKDYEKVKNAKPLDKTEQARFDELRAFRAEYNSMLHQTANAVAKVAFEKLASRHQGEKMGITLGGCASGKGFGLEHPEMFQGTYKGKSLQEYTKGTKIWWDSAGEQGAAELNWFTNTAKKNKSKSITYINTETNASAAARNAGGRVAEKGRLVSFEAFYDSYVNTRTNFEKFAKANNRDASLNIITVKNMGKGSKEPLTILKSGSKLSEFPSKAEMKSVYESAIKNSGLPKSVEDAAMTGFSFTFKLN